MNTKKIIEDNKFHIKKKYGQNFLTDKKILDKIISSANISSNTGVIEIGPGLGALTYKLCENAKHVLAYEIDSELIPILNENLKEFNNIDILNIDVLEADVSKDIKKYLSDCEEVIVVANLPYYITTPILLNLLQNIHINRYIVMMQLEVADRICGKTQTKDYNSLSITIQYQASCKKLFKVPRTVFNPAPNVDSAVIEIDVYKDIKHKPRNESFFFDVVRSSFAQRRKTLMNNLINRFGPEKEKFTKILDKLGIKQNARSEELSVDDFVNLADEILTAFMSDEEVDLYDANCNPLGIKVRRNALSDPNAYFKVVSGIVRYNGLYLIQKRSPYKPISPSIYELPGGGLDSGEEEITGLVREIKEETEVDIENIKLIDRVVGHYIIRCIYLADAKSDKVVLHEAVEYKWVTKEELKNLTMFKKYPYLLEKF